MTMTSKRTTLVRINKDLKEELIVSFPKTPMPELLDIMYRTSGIRVENVLRKYQKRRLKK